MYDTKGVIKSGNSKKDRQYNILINKDIKDKQWLTK
jgi:hypothetical protein